MDLAVSVVVHLALLALPRVQVIQSHRYHCGLFLLNVKEFNKAVREKTIEVVLLGKDLLNVRLLNAKFVLLNNEERTLHPT